MEIQNNNGKINNLGWWILGGVIVVGVGLWLLYTLAEKKKEEDIKNKI
jgi:hypothetical protein